MKATTRQFLGENITLAEHDPSYKKVELRYKSNREEVSIGRPITFKPYWGPGRAYSTLHNYIVLQRK